MIDSPGQWPAFRKCRLDRTTWRMPSVWIESAVSLFLIRGTPHSCTAKTSLSRFFCAAHKNSFASPCPLVIRILLRPSPGSIMRCAKRNSQQWERSHGVKDLSCNARRSLFIFPRPARPYWSVAAAASGHRSRRIGPTTEEDSRTRPRRSPATAKCRAVGGIPDRPGPTLPAVLGHPAPARRQHPGPRTRRLPAGTEVSL
ncbi:poly(3-hydroxyalkanoate) synthetase domain protein [Escherichia coli 2-156-04_S4_C2]|nr:poly(3-hydroxyalkanoate) synthetase domain protein [Escherichia coli 2-156-04_S4_C2]